MWVRTFAWYFLRLAIYTLNRTKPVPCMRFSGRNESIKKGEKINKNLEQQQQQKNKLEKVYRIVNRVLKICYLRVIQQLNKLFLLVLKWLRESTGNYAIQ